MALSERDDVVGAFASNGSDHALGEGVLPRGLPGADDLVDAEDAGGAASIVWMNEYLDGNTNMKKKILRYNEDDCRATYFLKNTLIKMQNDMEL